MQLNDWAKSEGGGDDRRTKRRRNWAGLSRVIGVWSLCFGLGLGLWVKSAVAGVGESIDDLGQQMLAWYGGKTTSAPRLLSINGLPFRLESAVTDATIQETFDHFAAQCRKRAGVTTEQKTKDSGHELALEDYRDLGSGVLRRASEEKGTIVCIDTTRPLEATEILARIRRYTETWNLSDIGQLRALSAHRVGGRTQVLMMAAVGAMSLKQAFPKAGDVPGQEPKHVPRPPESRRMFDAAEHDVGNAIHIYESPGHEPSVLAAFYRTELEDRGWTVTDGRSPGMLLAEQGQRRLLVLSTAVTAEKLRTSLVELSR